MMLAMSTADAPKWILASVAEDFQTSGVLEIKAAYGESLKIERLGPDLVAACAPGLTVAQMAADCQSRPIVFVKHLTQEVGRLTGVDATDLMDVSRFVLEVLQDQNSSGREPWVSLHTWSTGRLTVPYGPPDLARQMTTALAAKGWSVDPARARHALSVCLTPRGVVVGYTAKQHTLSDWPGGRIRLARSPQQISRAEFKLEELLKVSHLRLPAHGRALDLGAAPGGWTRILRQSGLRVTAVDPGELANPLLHDPAVHHERTTASEFLRRTHSRFDVVVNDMKMDPTRSSEVMVEAAHKLRQGGLAIMTLKLNKRDSHAMVQAAMRQLNGHYRTVFARQLHHNRNEVTVAMRPQGT